MRSKATCLTLDRQVEYGRMGCCFGFADPDEDGGRV